MAREFDGNPANHVTPLSIDPNFPTTVGKIRLDSLGQYAIAGKWTTGFGQLSFLLEILPSGRPSWAVNVPPIFQVIGGTVLSTGVDYHIAGVYDGVNMIVYVDGVVDGATAPGIGFTVNTGGQYEIGFRSAGGPFSFDGGIAEVATWGNPRTAREIAAMAGGVSPARYPNDLLSFCPLWGVDSPEPDLVKAAGAAIVGTVPARATPLQAGQPWGVYG